MVIPNTPKRSHQNQVGDLDNNSKIFEIVPVTKALKKPKNIIKISDMNFNIERDSCLTNLNNNGEKSFKIKNEKIPL